MAAGRGSRLLPLTLEKPKCLLEVGGKPILVHQINALCDVGIENFEIITGHGDTLVRESLSGLDASIKFTCNREYTTTNSLYSLGCATTRPGDEGLILLNSDVLFHRGLARMLLDDKRDNVLLADFQATLGVEEMKITVDNDYRVTGISKSINPLDGQAENVGLLKIGQETAAGILEIARDPGHLETLAWVPDAIHALRNDIEVHGLSTGKIPWIEIDFLDDLEDARNKIWPQLALAAMG